MKTYVVEFMYAETRANGKGTPMIKGSGYVLEQVANFVGVKPRVIRYWIERNLLPRPLGFGRAAKYTDEHLLRARVIMKLRAQRTNQRAIRSYLNSHTLAEFAQLVGPLQHLQQGTEGMTEPMRQSAPLPAAGHPAWPQSGNAQAQGLPLPSRWDLFLIGRGLLLFVSLDEVLDLWQLAQQIVSTYRPIVMRMQRTG
jgi:DNA-binding transcriptional MerR regulator